jgi:hypothetical protein
MIKLRLLFALAVVSLCSAAHAQSACPWLTEGTAAAMLEGQVTVTTKLLPTGEGSCAFTLQKSGATAVIEINVAASVGGSCPANSAKLAGIGNEAVYCTEDRSPKETTNIVRSRVRDVFFVVRLTVTGKTPAAATPAQRQAVAEQVAEEVAGNLE